MSIGYRRASEAQLWIALGILAVGRVLQLGLFVFAFYVIIFGI